MPCCTTKAQRLNPFPGMAVSNAQVRLQKKNKPTTPSIYQARRRAKTCSRSVRMRDPVLEDRLANENEGSKELKQNPGLGTMQGLDPAKSLSCTRAEWLTSCG